MKKYILFAAVAIMAISISSCRKIETDGEIQVVVVNGGGGTPTSGQTITLQGRINADTILRKANKEVSDFSIKVTGELSKQAPIAYVAMHVVYDFQGEPTHQEAALEAVTLSQEKYCGVSQMLKKALPVTWEVNYNELLIFNNRVPSMAISEN